MGVEILRAVIAGLMVRVHLISPELAVIHTNEMDESELLRRLVMYAQQGVTI